MTAFAYKDLLTYQRMNELLQQDGTVALTANWDAGSFEIRAQTFESDVTTGTAPFTVASTTVVTNLNADTVDGVHVTGFATFNYSGAKVYDAAAPLAMTDLDLSGTIGSARVLVYLKVKLDDAGGGATYYFRTDDEVDTQDTSLGGVTQFILTTNTHFKYIWALTDATGVVEWYATAARNTEIYVLAYVK